MNMFKPAQNGDDMIRKGPWMPEEDEILVQYVRQYGARDWSSIRSKGLLPRTGKSCRLRWVNKLKPDLKRSGCKFSPEEEKLVVEMQAKLGNKWAKIASFIPGRTDNDVKNFWSTRQKRILRAMQHPKAQSGSTGLAADRYDVSKNSCTNEFSAIQMSTLAGPGSRLSFSFNPQFHSSDDQSALLGDFRRLGCKSRALFDGVIDDNGLMVRLQDLVASESFFVGSDLLQTRKISTDEAAHGISILSGAAASSTSFGPVKRRPRSRRDIKSGFDYIASESLREGLLPEIPPLECNIPDFEAELYDPLDFLLQPEILEVHNNQSIICSDQLPELLQTSQQWERMPFLHNEDSSTFPESNTKKELLDSCTPDSVLGGFPGDVFDSLEPLSPTGSEWWISR